MSIENTRAVADAYLPAFLAGERAPAEMYAETVTVWHNIGEVERTLSEPPSYARLRDAMKELRHEDVRVLVGEDAFLSTPMPTRPRR